MKEDDHAIFLASNALSSVAFKAAGRSPSDADQNLVAILFSAAWFESALNEFLSHLLDARPEKEVTERSRRIRVNAEAAGLGERMASVERKLRVICAAATDRPFLSEIPPWREVLLLSRLRNWMVHLRPERMSVRPGAEDEPSLLVSVSVHQLVTDLLEVGAIQSIPQGRMVPVMIAVQLQGVGRWAYRTAFSGLEALGSWVPEWKNSVMLGHHPPSAIGDSV